MPTEAAIDVTAILAMLKTYGPFIIALLTLAFPQAKQVILTVLQGIVDAINGLPTVVKSTAGPSDAQTFRAYQTMRKRCTCPIQRKALDEAFQNALTGEAK